MIKYSTVEAPCHFVRPPHIGFFKVNGGFDFIFAAIHVVWGKKIDRVIEIENINILINKIVKSTGGEGDIILAGDFNMPPENFSLPPEWIPLINGGTTVLKSGGEGSRYDNIWINKNNTSEYAGKSEIIKSAGGSDHYPIVAYFNNFDDDEGIPNLNDIKL